MKRRQFLTKAGVAAAGLGVLGACSSGGPANAEGPAVHTKKKVMWRLASSFPRSLDSIYGAAEVMANRLEAMTDGMFKIRVYPAGEMVPAMQVLDAVQQATVQVGHTSSYYYKGKNPALAFDTTLPFGLTARQQTAWLYQGGGLEAMRKVLADFNIINFPGGNTGIQMGGWFNREINSAADLNGLKMRIPGMGGEVMSRLGATVQVLAGGDIFPALERGAIDATEWVGPYDDEKLGFHKVTKLYYYPGWWEPGPNLSFYVNQGAWASLPKAYQEAFTAAAAEAGQWMLVKYDRENPPAMERLVNDGVQMKLFASDIMTQARKHTTDILEELSADDPSYASIYEPWKKFRDQSYAWFQTAESAYGAFAFPQTL
jgi:TRAP-type mannitol/chloroaromatic compound transport system substrate-binding protein